MTTNSATQEHSDSRRAAVVSRLRGWLRRFNPAMLGVLGLLSLPGYVLEELSPLRVFGVFSLFFLWLFVGPIVDTVLARGTETETEPTDWLQVGSAREYAVGYLMIPLTLLNPPVFAQDLLQGLGGLVTFVRHGGSLPDAASYDQQVSYRLPVEGTWTVVNGSPERTYSHSWLYPNQRYAYDLLVTDEEGRSRPADADTAVEEYYCYDEPVLAPADGVVVDAFDTALEAPRGGGFSHPLKRSIPGGHVVIRHAESEYSFLAHLRPGSVTVEPGDRVQRGQTVGRCGHSGNSSEPHLHFQVQDRPDFAVAASLPVQFDDVRIESPGVTHDPDLVPGEGGWHTGSTDDSPADPSPAGHHDRTFVAEGQRVTHADRPGDGSGEPASRVGAVGTARDATDRPGDGPAESTSPDAAPSVPTAPVGRPAALLRRTALGLVTAGLLTAAGRVLLPDAGIAVLLGGAAALALAGRVGFGLLAEDGFRARTGSAGSALGLALAAGVVVAGVTGTGTLTGLFLLTGVLGYVAVVEYDTARLRGASPSG